MHKETFRLPVREITLHGTRWLPDAEPRGGVAVIHGQGDHGERYEASAVSLFLAHGHACCALDLPGHGRSPGRRGAVPGIAFARAALRAAFAAAAAMAPGRPAGIFAHSMGGLLTLDLLTAEEPPCPAFLWLNAPLLRPGHRQSAWRLALAHAASRLLPGLTLDTGVRDEDCRHSGDDPALVPATGLFHRKITLGWGRELLDCAERVATRVAQLPPNLPLLYTQGLADPVCPAPFARAFFEMLPCSPKRFVPLDGARHEGFDDTTRPAFLAAGEAWLAELAATVLSPAC